MSYICPRHVVIVSEERLLGGWYGWAAGTNERRMNETREGRGRYVVMLWVG